MSGAALLTAAAQQPGPPAVPSDVARAMPVAAQAGPGPAWDAVLRSLEGGVGVRGDGAGVRGDAAAGRAMTSEEGAARPASDVGLPRSRPVGLRIPSIGVDTRLMGVGLNADGTVETPPPRRDAPAGWYRYLVTPGEVGAAVILGHVDTPRDGPAVFYRLGELRPEDRIDVTRADGSVARFVVTRVVLVAKAEFPTADVYGPTADPQLRLVTCGGSYDHVRHTYRDNVVVFARLAPSG